MDVDRPTFLHRVRPRLLAACGAVGWLGAVAVVVADLVGILVVDAHDPISETISKLAVGRAAWIQDLGLSLFGLGAAAVAAGLAAWRTGGAAWKAGVTATFLVAVDLVVIARYNEYAGELGQGATVHRVLVYALYGLFSIATVLLARGLGNAGRRWTVVSVAAFLAWTIFAPLLFVVPTSLDGAYERLVGCILVAWFAAVSAMLILRRNESNA